MWTIFGKTLKESQQVVYALPTLFGIGFSTSLKICLRNGICKHKKISELTKSEKEILWRDLKKNYVLENSLKEIIKQNIIRIKEIKCRRGMRHIAKLPVRGQRTHSNARSIRRFDLFSSVAMNFNKNIRVNMKQSSLKKGVKKKDGSSKSNKKK